jgi:uncharacterized membrane protein
MVDSEFIVRMQKHASVFLGLSNAYKIIMGLVLPCFSLLLLGVRVYNRPTNVQRSVRMVFMVPIKIPLNSQGYFDA